MYYRSEVGDLIANIFGESEDEGEFEVSKHFLSYMAEIILNMYFLCFLFFSLLCPKICLIKSMEIYHKH